MLPCKLSMSNVTQREKSASGWHCSRGITLDLLPSIQGSIYYLTWPTPTMFVFFIGEKGYRVIIYPLIAAHYMLSVLLRLSDHHNSTLCLLYTWWKWWLLRECRPFQILVVAVSIDYIECVRTNVILPRQQYTILPTIQTGLANHWPVFVCVCTWLSIVRYHHANLFHLLVVTILPLLFLVFQHSTHISAYILNWFLVYQR